ncbi:MAG: NUDIX hydrolase [Parahaliea sp.]
MMAVEGVPAEALAHPSATIILLRDSKNGPQVLLVQRNEALRHMGGMWVFPGGRVEPEDEVGDALANARQAAVRETREEAGLNIAPEHLLYFSHWTTPGSMRKRFSTWFFIAVLDGDQGVQIDGSEIVNYRWLSPVQALREVLDDKSALQLMPPTFVSLQQLTHYDSCQSVVMALEAAVPVIFAPRVVAVKGGHCFLYEGDAGFNDGDCERDGPRHRTYMTDERMEYLCTC